MKHPSSQETDVLYPIAHFVYDVAKFDNKMTEKNGKSIINLTFGEPTKANGYTIP